MDWITAPDNAGDALCDVVPSLLGAMGVPGFANVLELPECRSAAVLLVDGLGWSLLREHAADAPRLNELAHRGPLRAGFPATTATSVTSLGTGTPAGQHGIVGYSFAEPAGGLVNPLRWAEQGGGKRSLLDRWPPEQAQPHPTALERAADAGVAVRTVAPGELKDTGLTRAALRGGEFRRTHATGDLVAELLAALGEPAPVLCYGYHSQLDHLGHLHRPGSLSWRVQLQQIDQFTGALVDRLPRGTLLAVVADHGMVAIDPPTTIDFDREAELQRGVRLLGGEPRCRYVYTEPGALDDVAAAWRARLGEHGVVVTAERAFDEGWFGPRVDDPARERVGDLIAVLRDTGVSRSQQEPGESSLPGHHGSLTAEEQFVPLLLGVG